MKRWIAFVILALSNIAWSEPIPSEDRFRELAVRINVGFPSGLGVTGLWKPIPWWNIGFGFTTDGLGAGARLETTFQTPCWHRMVIFGTIEAEYQYAGDLNLFSHKKPLPFFKQFTYIDAGVGGGIKIRVTSNVWLFLRLGVSFLKTPIMDIGWGLRGDAKFYLPNGMLGLEFGR